MVRRSRRCRLVLAALAAAACSSGTEPQRVTTIVVSPSPVALASIGATQQMSAAVQDQNGNPMSGVTVTWGSTNSLAAGVSPAGLVTAVGNGTTQITASASGQTSAGVTVTVAQVPGLFTKQGGDGQNGLTNVALGTPISVRVADAGNAAIAGAIVTFTPAAGSGSVSQAADTTGVNGQAQVTWTLGASGGSHSLTASVPTGGAPLTVTFGATASAPGTPTSITALNATAQTALVGYATNSRPAVVVRDAANAVVAGAIVTFAVTAGGGTPTKPIDTTDANGIAQVGAWTVGAGPGTNTMTATVSGVSPATFNATAQVAAYNIEIRNIGPALSPAVQAAFDSAEAMWERVIFGDQTATPINTTNACGLGATIQETVDDVIILARFDSIDGPSQVLGLAGWCSIRVSNGLPIYGGMIFDTADVATMAANGTIGAVILHEMAHVLGFSDDIWNTQPGVIQAHTCAQNVPRDSLGTGTAGLDSHFSCPEARAAFDSIGGTSYTGGSKVPLENCTGLAQPCSLTATIYAHWRETVFGSELMTGFVSNANSPLSLVTIASFDDLGYVVNHAAAQSYPQLFTSPEASRGTLVSLGDDRLRVPVAVIDEQGRVVRIIPVR